MEGRRSRWQRDDLESARRTDAERLPRQEPARRGDPSTATAEKGRKLMEILVQRLGDFLYELSKAPMDDSFPFVSSEIDR